MSWRQRIRRYFKRLALGLALTLALLFAAACWLTQSASGRARLLAFALARLNHAIPGQVEVRELEGLSPSGVALRGLLVRDPTGAIVVRLERLDVQLEPRELLHSRIVLPEVSLSGGELDLRTLNEARHGLVAAFVDPAAPKAPPSPGPPPYVSAPRIELGQLNVRLPPLGALGQVDLKQLALQASFELDRSPFAVVQQLHAGVEREQQALGELEELGATLGRGPEPSILDVKLRLAGMSLALQAELVAPTQPDWKRQPLTASLRVDDVSGEALARLLRQPELKHALHGAVGLVLEAAGTPERLALDAELLSAAGQLGLRLRAYDLNRAHAMLVAKDFRPAALRPELPDHRLSLRLAFDADGSDPQRIPLALALRGEIDDTTLPELELETLLTPSRLEQLELRARDGKSRLLVRGSAGLQGGTALKLTADLERQALRKWATFTGKTLDARGQAHAELSLELDAARRLELSGAVTARGLEVGETRVERADLSLTLAGRPERPVGKLELELTGARVSGQALQRLHATATGGPDAYRLDADAALAEASASLGIELGLGKDFVELRGQGHGRWRDQPWKVELGATRARFDGALSSDGVTLDVAGQRARLQGSFARDGGTLALQAGPLDLGLWGRLLRAPEPLEGVVDLQARLEGTPEAPQINLRLSGRSLALGARPPLDVSLEARLDSQLGLLDGELRLTASEPKQGKLPLDLALSLTHRFKGGTRWQASVLDGQLDATLTLARLETHFIQAWGGLPALPAEGELSAYVHAGGTRSDPRLSARAASRLRALGSPLALETSLDYERGAANLAASVDDARGRWLNLDAALELAPGQTLSLAELLQRLPRAARDEAWRLRLEAQERRLDELPTLGRETAPVALSAALTASHSAGAEPDVGLQVHARPDRKLATYGKGACSGADARLELRAQLGQGKLNAELLGLDGASQLLRGELKAPLSLAPALSGEAPELGPLKGELRAERLSLPSLPLICGVARGTLTAKVAFDDPLGPHPSAQAQLSARGFSLGAPDTLDAALDAELNGDGARADLQLTAGAGSSTLHAELPLATKGGRLGLAQNAAVRADLSLKGFPISPFLDPGGAVSYASGTVDGSAQVRGTLDKPTLQGELRLNDLAFTATELAQPLRNVRGTLRFSQNKLLIDGFQAHDKDGSLRLDGSVAFEPQKLVAVKLAILAEKFPLRQQGQVVATADIAAKVQTNVRAARTDVAIDLGKVDVWIESTAIRAGVALAPHPDFTIDGVTPPTPATPDAVETPQPAQTAKAQPNPSPAEPAHVTQLTLTGHEAIWVKRDDFAVKLSTELQTRIQGDEARVTGGVKLERGYLALMGKSFDIVKGSHLDFIGSAMPDPVLDISALHENRRSGERISVQIGGRSSAPVLTFRVDDRVVSAGAAFQAIYGAQQSNRTPKGANGEAKAFVGGLTAGLLATTARRELGAAAPIVMIEPGEQSGQGRIRAGFEFDSLVPKFLRDVVTGVYFEGIVAKESTGNAPAQENDARVRAGFLLELYYPRNFFSAGQYGPGATWSVDFGWQL